MSQADNPQQKPISGEATPEVEQELSQVATNPKQSLVILIVIGAVFLYLFFNFFISGDDSDKKIDDTPIPSDVAKPISINVDSEIPSIPTLPSPPKLEDPTPPPPPPATEALPEGPVELPALPTNVNLPSANSPTAPTLPFVNAQSEESLKRAEAKRKSSIVLVAGTLPNKTAEQIQEEADFKYRGDMNLVLGHGKLLDAIIETAVNTDLGGEIRAVISRDIYSEWGKNILLPKGSRVFGNYATGIDGSYGRISITWTRVDLSNGYSLNLSGIGTDALGRKGNQGRVDNKFKERFSNAILRSTFNVVLAQGLDKAVTPQISSQATANLNQVSTDVMTIANSVFSKGPTDQRTTGIQICTQTQAAIKDQTSTLFTQIKTACDTFIADTNTNESAKILSLMSAITTAASTSTQNTTANSEESKAQAATKQAYTDISDVVKTLIAEQELKPTITIDQGTPIKIYVNKDYKFPRAAISKTRSSK